MGILGLIKRRGITATLTTYSAGTPDENYGDIEPVASTPVAIKGILDLGSPRSDDSPIGVTDTSRRKFIVAAGDAPAWPPTPGVPRPSLVVDGLEYTVLARGPEQLGTRTLFLTEEAI